MKLVVDRDACMSIAYCVDEAPNTLALDEHYIAVIKQQDGDPSEMILEAAKSCPVNAIKCFDDHGKQIWPETEG